MGSPPFKLTPSILLLCTSIQEIVGELKGYALEKSSVKLRKLNKARTIHHSLSIEGNTLSEQQVTALLDGKRVLGPKKYIQEVQNAISLYEQIQDFDPFLEKDLLRAHKELMQDLLPKPGRYRSHGVGIFKGKDVSHIAPPAKLVPDLMKRLFIFLNEDYKILLPIKACIFHYELEFIHPFEDGNGRMGRLWQQLILMKHSPLFEFVSVETLIHKKQKAYYKILEKCDRTGESTEFVEFSLEIILKSLEQFKQDFRPQRARPVDRIDMAAKHFGKAEFTRKEYMQLHTNISTATASRDLAEAVSERRLVRNGDKAKSSYKAVKP